ncbi:ARHG7 factor, partial [Heliornis fulica]|nr:ARHG7 factor [Heliornis fulica]
MGCCSLSTRQPGSAGPDQDEVELLKTSRTRVSSNSEGHSEASLHPKDLANPAETEDVNGLWGRTQEELADLLVTQPISGWEGMNIHSLGEIIWSSLVSLGSYCLEDMCECYIVLSSFHLLILSVDHTKKTFVYEGLLPLAGMHLREIAGAVGHTFEISGAMIESRLISCRSSADFNTWVRHLQHQIKRANTHCPVSPNNNIAFLVSQCTGDIKRR